MDNSKNSGTQGSVEYDTAEFTVRTGRGDAVFSMQWALSNKIPISTTVANLLTYIQLPKEPDAAEPAANPSRDPRRNGPQSSVATRQQNTGQLTTERQSQDTTSAMVTEEDEPDVRFASSNEAQAASGASSSTNPTAVKTKPRQATSTPTAPQYSATSSARTAGRASTERHLYPRIPSVNATSTYFCDSRDKRHWQTVSDWKGFMKDGHKLPIGYIMQTARQEFPEARLRIAEYLGKTGPARLHLWFEPDETMSNDERYKPIGEFMDFLVLQIGPSDSNVAPPDSYGPMKNMATVETTRKKAPKPAAQPGSQEKGSLARAAAADWPKDQQGVRVVMTACTGNHSYPNIKRSFATAGLDENRVFVQYLDGKRDEMALSFVKGVEEEEIKQFMSVIMFNFGANGFRDATCTHQGETVEFFFSRYDASVASSSAAASIVGSGTSMAGKRKRQNTPQKDNDDDQGSDEEAAPKVRIHPYFDQFKQAIDAANEEKRRALAGGSDLDNVVPSSKDLTVTNEEQQADK